MAPLDVLPLAEAKEHLNKVTNAQPGGDDELIEMIGAAVERVQEHLGGRELTAAAGFSERLACKVVLADYWKTQRPTIGGRQPYGGQAGFAQEDGPTSGASLMAKLTAILGPAVSAASNLPIGRFPTPTIPDLPEPPLWGCFR